MKKLYKKGTVHPTPPLISDHLSFLPATIFTLTAALSLQDREVLAYLLSCSSNNYAANNNNHKKNNNTANDSRTSAACGDHPPSFNCCCFRCYMSYWVRWDASPNRQLIHEIIDAFEEGLTSMKVNKEKNKRARRNQSRPRKGASGEFKNSELSLNMNEFSEADSVEEESSSSAAISCGGGGQSSSGEEGEGDKEGMEKGSVRRLVSFLGEKIWSVWN